MSIVTIARLALAIAPCGLAAGVAARARVCKVLEITRTPLWGELEMTRCF